MCNRTRIYLIAKLLLVRIGDALLDSCSTLHKAEIESDFPHAKENFLWANRRQRASTAANFLHARLAQLRRGGRRSERNVLARLSCYCGCVLPEQVVVFRAVSKRGMSSVMSAPFLSQPVNTTIRLYFGKTISSWPPNPTASQLYSPLTGYSHQLNP